MSKRRGKAKAQPPRSAPAIAVVEKPRVEAAAPPASRSVEAAEPWRALPIACFVGSGFSGLVYEIAWIRKASLVFGSTTFAVSTVLAVFFLGLAIGSSVFGRRGQRTTRPLRLYAILEVALGLLAYATLLGFDLADAILGTLHRSLGDGGSALIALRIALVAALLLPATILMGGTLPLFCRHYASRDPGVARSVGALYAANTLGAAAGCAAAGFVMLPALGLLSTVLVAAFISVACGLAVGLSSEARRELPAIEPEVTASGAIRRIRILDALCFAAGFVALAGEVLWTRYLTLLLRNTVYTYTISLLAVLVGIVIGSAAASRLFERTTSRARWLGTLLAAWGATTLALMMVPAATWRGLGPDVAVYFLALLPPAILSGASFPWIVATAIGDPRLASAATGRMAASNILGGIVGSLLAGFLGLPIFGLQASLLAVTLVAIAAGIAAWMRLDRSGDAAPRWILAAASIAAWIAIPRMTGARVPADLLGDRAALVDFHEGYGSDLAVLRDEDGLELQIDRWWQGSDRKNHQAVAAHVPMLLHEDPRSVLVIGSGTGQTASRFLLYDGVTRLDVADIEPSIFSFVELHFDSRWTHDPRVTLLAEDGRDVILHGASSYDVISIEVGQVFRPGIASFYTAELYNRARRRLAPRGVLAQFVPISFFTPDELRGVVRTFVEVFPRSVLWYNTAELLLVGVNDPELALGGAMLARLASNARASEDLAWSPWGGADRALNRPEVLLAGFLLGPRGLAELGAGAPVYHDDRPVLDYATAGVEEAQTRELPIVELLRPRLEPIDALLPRGTGGVSQAAIDTIREQNLGEIIATARIREAQPGIVAGDYERALPLLDEAVRASPGDFAAQRILADVLAAAGRLDAAITHYEEAVRIRPDDARALAGYAQCLHGAGRLDRAIELYVRAIQAKPDDAGIHNRLGAALGQRGSYAQAASEFEAALRLQPDLAEAKTNLEATRAALRSAPAR